jgi:hypothetical protein
LSASYAATSSVAPANTLTGTTLATNVVTSSLTSVGTLTGLTVSADATINSVRVGVGPSPDYRNTVVGALGLAGNLSGVALTAVGYATLIRNTTGGGNTAIGTQASFENTVGSFNTALGNATLYNNTSGSNNTALGDGALSSNTTGNDNIAIGRLAGQSLTTGNNNTIIGTIINGTAGLADTVIIGAGSAERLRIDSTGNTGFGTTSPGAKLHVQGNVSASSFTGSLFGTASNAISASFATTASYVAAGSVGGTVLSASYAVTASNANLLDGYDSATTATANTIALRDNNGNVQFNRVGIGATPSYDLHINKATSPSIYLESGNDDSKIYLTDTARYIAGIAGSAIGIYTNSGIRGRYDLYGTRVYGALGVGLTPDVGWTAGEIRATNNITAYSSSDKRLKQNIIPLANALDKISKINGVSFDWTQKYIDEHGGEDSMFIRKHDVGVIAQEIEEILPEIVATRDDGYLAVRYEKIIPLLIQAIKELNAKVEELSNGK